MKEHAFITPYFMNAVKEILKCSVKDVVSMGIDDLRNCNISAEIKPEHLCDSKDYVTSIDKNNECFLCACLTDFGRKHWELAGCCIVGEEAFDASSFEKQGEIIASMGKGYCWVIDPLDGTNNLIRYLKNEQKETPPHGVMISLLFGGKPIAGWDYFYHNELGEGIIYGSEKTGVIFEDWRKGNKETKTEKLSGEIGDMPSAILFVDAWPEDKKKLIESSISKGLVTPYEHVSRSAAVDTAAFLLGKADAAAFSVFRVWDHYVLAALTRTLGGHVAMTGDGGDCVPVRNKSGGVMAARNKGEWLFAHKRLFGSAPGM